jgi:uncharacterized BrkB/YihY/UPF0761 family membrane protein
VVKTPSPVHLPDSLETMADLIARIIAWALERKPVRAFLLYSERRGPMLADSVTYRALFSVFAGVLLGFSIAGLVLSGNPQLLQALIDAVDAAIPGLVGADGIIDPSSIAIPVGLTLTTILSIIGLVGIPVGTLINGWILYLIHCKKGQTILSPGYQDIIAATPHVKYRRSVGDWIALGLVLAILLGIVGLLIFSALR